MERVYDTKQVLAMAERLSVDEITILGRGTDMRERGLQLAREGNPDAAVPLLAQSRRVCETSALSMEAGSCAETFQFAAESYILYKYGDFDAATKSIMRSLQVCEYLSVEYGYPLEMRRVHLARNVARLRAAAGDKAEALRIGLGLLQYLGGIETAWPFLHTGGQRRAFLEAEAAEWVLDQVLAEVVRELELGCQAAIDKGPEVEETGSLIASKSPLFRQAAHCLSACVGFLASDPNAFLEDLSRFFEGGPHRLVFSWQEMDKKVELLHN